MPTAKEMFAELGFKLNDEPFNKVFMVYRKEIDDDEREYDDENHVITFNNVTRSFYADLRYYDWKANETSLPIDIPTFKAIHQQLKELGWLDDCEEDEYEELTDEEWEAWCMLNA